jgi:hypothetical protein
MAQNRHEFPPNPFDRKAIFAAVDFANLKLDEVPVSKWLDHVRTIFAPLAKTEIIPPRRRKLHARGVPIWKRFSADEVRGWELDQLELRQWLEQIWKKGSVLPDALTQIQERVQEIPISSARVRFDENQRLRPALELVLGDPRGCFSYAAALLIQDGVGYDRLFRCKCCRDFKFDARRGGGRAVGRPMEYCGEVCGRTVRRWREKHPNRAWPPRDGEIAR